MIVSLRSGLVVVLPSGLVVRASWWYVRHVAHETLGEERRMSSGTWVVHGPERRTSLVLLEHDGTHLPVSIVRKV